MRVGVVGHRGYAGLPEVLQSLVELAPTLGLSLVFESELRELAGKVELLDDPKSLDALLTLGGDGTLLRGARLLNGAPVPILGVNLGRLGFLTSCGPEELDQAMRRLASGEFRAEVRMTLEARITPAKKKRGSPDRRWIALNDVVLHKGGFARVVRLTVFANGEEVATYAADGLVVSTPTGSTAYSLSAGGPVIVPTLESILLTPISPHTLAIRPLVLPPSAEVTVRVEDVPEELLVTIDGQVGNTFSAGETLVIKRASQPVRIVRFPGSTFFALLRRKLGWGGYRDPDEPTAC